MNDLERAVAIALDAYEGQTKPGRRTSDTTLRVMEAMYTQRERMVAVLHDVVKDAAYSLKDIGAQFDAEIRDAVDALTKRDGEDYLKDFVPRADRTTSHGVSRSRTSRTIWT